MAKKRKDKKFSKTKQRPKNRIRDSINRIRAGLGSEGRDRGQVVAYLSNFGDGLNLPPAAPPAPVGETAGQRRQRLANQPPGGSKFSAMKGKADVLLYSGSAGKPALHLNLTRTSPDGESELNDTLRAIMEGDGTRPIPNEIAVSAKDGDEDDVMEQLKQMVADMNEEARGDKSKPQYTLDLLSSTKSGPKGPVNMQFLLAPVGAVDAARLDQVMSSAELKAGLGKDAAATGSRQYRDMVAQLDNYHQAMADFIQKLTDNSDTPDDLQNAMDARRLLSDAARAYLAKHKGLKKNAAERLITQLNETDPLSKFNAMKFEDSTEGAVLGLGSKGPIKARLFSDGFEAAFKADSTEATSPARGVGITRNNPQESRRAVVAYAVDDLLGLGVIPETRFATQTEDDGAVKLGQAMKVVHGFVGQRLVRTRQLSPREIADEVAIARRQKREIKSDDVYEVVRDANNDIVEMYEHRPRVVQVNYDGGKLQKGLSDLQLLDNIIGAADRHPGNWIYESTGPNDEITSVQGIDNDDAHGQDWEADRKQQFANSKTPPVPPLIDVESAIKVLQADRNALQARLSLLPPTQAAAELVRFDVVRTAVLDRVEKGEIASDDGTITPQQIAKLRAGGAKLLGAASDRPINTYKWGTAPAKALHTEQNSYLGNVLARQQVEGDTPKNFK